MTDRATGPDDVVLHHDPSRHHLRQLRHYLGASPSRYVWACLIPLLLAVVVGKITFEISMNHNLNGLRTYGNKLLSVYAGRLNEEVDQYGLLPSAAARDPKLVSFLKSPDPAEVAEISRHLLTLNDSVGALQTFLILPSGRVAASSNWNKPSSYVGKNLSYRPYFQKANPLYPVRFSAIGTTDVTPGYYLASEVVSDGRRVGVIAIKLGFDQLRRPLKNTGQPILMVDENNVVVLSSVRQWEYHMAGDVPLAKKHMPIAKPDLKLRYGGNTLLPLIWKVHKVPAPNAQLLDVGIGQNKHEYLAMSRDLPEIGLKLIMLADPSGVYQLAFAHCVVAMTLVVLICLLFLILRMRRRSLKERFMHQRALEQAYNNLELLVEKRNAELKATNLELRKEVTERSQAVEQLKAYQEELVRTENLTVIGQLSAGLAHEMNQPLGALSMLTDNTIRFMEQNALDVVKSNLKRIGDLVDRLGTIAGQLRSFARQTAGDSENVDVADSVEDSLMLLAHRMKQSAVTIVTTPPKTPCIVLCNKTRLEQVLVNLVSNAIDATDKTAFPRVEIRWFEKSGRVRIEVSDNGIGFNDTVKSRLFEPFFTTKKTSGLGLGLAISADVIRSFGGTLSGDGTSGSGAVFTIDLPYAEHDRATHD